MNNYYYKIQTRYKKKKKKGENEKQNKSAVYKNSIVINEIN